MTPFQALYGFTPPQINEVILPDNPTEEVVDILQKRRLANEHIKDNLVKAQDKTKKYADKHRKEREFNVGDMVYLKIQTYIFEHPQIPKMTLKVLWTLQGDGKNWGSHLHSVAARCL
jgi:DNA-directed RNA polymerase subunit E'/Rpb7